MRGSVTSRGAPKRMRRTVFRTGGAGPPGPAGVSIAIDGNGPQGPAERSLRTLYAFLRAPFEGVGLILSRRYFPRRCDEHVAPVAIRTTRFRLDSGRLGS